MTTASARPPAARIVADRLVQSIGAARPEHDRDPLAREMLRDGQSDAGRSPGHHRDAAGEVHPRMIQSRPRGVTRHCGTHRP